MQIKYTLITALILCSNIIFGQSIVHSNDTLPQYFGAPVEVVDKEFLREYNRLKPIVLKVYPYALGSADILDEMNHDLESIKKRRKRNKFCNQSYKELKKEYKYVFMDLYPSEGRVLIKLVSRETGMTLYNIVQTYKGQKDATMFNLMGKMWDQDIKSDYDPQKESVLEAVIADIQSGKIKFDSTAKTMNKEAYKEKQAQSKKNKKVNHKKAKELRKKKRKKKRKSNKEDAK